MKRKTKLTMFVYAVLACAMITHSGCAYVAGYTRNDGTNSVTKLRAATFFDSHNDVAKAAAMTSTNHSGTSLSGLSQTSSGTNGIAALQAVQGILQALPK